MTPVGRDPGANLSERLLVPRGSGRAIRVAAGKPFAVVDIEGGQVGDLFMFADDGSGEFLSASHTRMTTGRLFPLEGQAFASDQRRPMATVLEDDHQGNHDMLCAACDPARYRQLGADPGHASCAANLKSALESVGLPVEVIPQPVNVFMRVRASDDGSIELLPAISKPGDRLVMRAERDLVVILSACPQDLSPVNSGFITDLALEY